MHGASGGKNLRPAIAVAIVVIVVAVVAAGGWVVSREGSSAGVPGRIQAMWRETAPWVAVGAQEPLLVPGPGMPTSVAVEAIVSPVSHGKTFRAGSGVPDLASAAQTLYADPESAEPWAARAVMVGRVPASDVEGTFNPGRGTAVVIQGREGRVGLDHGLWFASWSIPTCDVCDQEAFVMGYGLTRAGVLRIADSVRQQPTPRADVATLPAGLRPLGSLPGAQGTVITEPSAQQLVVRAGGTQASMTILSGDSRLYAHLAFWSRGGRPVESWRRRGWAVVVDRGDHVVDLTARSKPSATEAASFRAAALALVSGDDKAVEEARDRVNLEPLSRTRNLCQGVEGPWKTFSGVIGTVRWAQTLVLINGEFLYSCHEVWTVDRAHAASGGGGHPLDDVAPGGVRLSGFGNSSLPDGRWLRIVAGDVPSPTVRVQVKVGDQTVDATPEGIGPAPDRRWFATAFVWDGVDTGGQIGVSAFDASGATVAIGAAEDN